MELDADYSNVNHVKNADEYPEKWAAAGAQFRGAEQFAGRARLNISYGDSPRQAFDLFYPAGQARALVIFVHGGYWRRFDRTDHSHFAAALVGAGCVVGMPSYDLCPTVRLAQITKQIARAVPAIAAAVPELPVILLGHSAGGHLVARMAQPGLLPADLRARITALVPISPVSDLRPLLRTSMNNDIRLDAAEAQAESPALAHGSDIPTHVWVGAAELPAFVEQAQTLASAWDCPCTLEPGRHHFDVVERLEDPHSALIRMILGHLP